jgi:hypothetical protein
MEEYVHEDLSCCFLFFIFWGGFEIRASHSASPFSVGYFSRLGFPNYLPQLVISAS